MPSTWRRKLTRMRAEVRELALRLGYADLTDYSLSLMTREDLVYMKRFLRTLQERRAEGRGEL